MSTFELGRVRGAAEWAQTLKSEWEERARSSSRDFFVASHLGWNDPLTWERQAACDVSFLLTDLDRARLLQMDLLEIGCGVGRLVRPVAPLVRSYTGFDVSGSMVFEASRRCADLSSARFFESDGAGIPTQAMDRTYQLIIAHAVFIHCPIEVTRSLISAALAAMDRDGEFRLSLRADHNDLEGIVTFESASVTDSAAHDMEVSEIPDRHLIDDRNYAGTPFTYAAARQFLSEFGEVRVDLVRIDRMIIYARLRHALSPRST